MSSSKYVHTLPDIGVYTDLNVTLLSLSHVQLDGVKLIYDLYSTLQSAKYNINKEKKEEEGTDRQIYTVVAHINVSHEQIG